MLQPTPWEVVSVAVRTQLQVLNCGFHNFYQMSSRCERLGNSRDFGQNYWFDGGARHGPSQPVHLPPRGARPAVGYGQCIRTAPLRKRKHFFSRHRDLEIPAGSELQNRADSQKAWVRNVAYVKYVWADTQRVSTAPTRWCMRGNISVAIPEGGWRATEDFFIYDDKIYQGSRRWLGHGPPWTRPRMRRKVQFPGCIRGETASSSAMGFLAPSTEGPGRTIIDPLGEWTGRKRVSGYCHRLSKAIGFQ